MQQMRRSLQEEPDIHGRLMSLYPQGNITATQYHNSFHVHYLPLAFPTVPEWWYLVLFVVVFILGILTIEWWHTQMPVWAFVFALLICKPAFSLVVAIGR